MTAWMVGIDTGGTFTDLIAFNVDSGALRIAKVPSQSEDPSNAVMAALGELVGDESLLESAPTLSPTRPPNEDDPPVCKVGGGRVGEREPTFYSQWLRDCPTGINLPTQRCYQGIGCVIQRLISGFRVRSSLRHIEKGDEIESG